MNNSRSTKISVGMFYQIQSDIYITESLILLLAPGGLVHPRLAVYFLGGGGGELSRLVPSNSTGTGLTDHLYLGSPHLIPGGVGLVKTRVFSLISTDFFVIILASQAH